MGKIFLYLITLLSVGHSQAAPLDLQQIADRFAIEETITNLFIKTDEKDWVGVQKVFMPKVNFDMSSLNGEKPTLLTPKEITTMWEKGLKEIKAIHHQVGNFRFLIQGNSAEVHCYGTAFHYKPNKTKRNTRTFVGSYDFHLTRIDAGWSIDSFRYNSQFIDGNLKL